MVPIKPFLQFRCLRFSCMHSLSIHSSAFLQRGLHVNLKASSEKTNSTKQGAMCTNALKE